MSFCVQKFELADITLPKTDSFCVLHQVDIDMLYHSKVLEFRAENDPLGIASPKPLVKVALANCSWLCLHFKVSDLDLDRIVCVICWELYARLYLSDHLVLSNF